MERQSGKVTSEKKGRCQTVTVKKSTSSGSKQHTKHFLKGYLHEQTSNAHVTYMYCASKKARNFERGAGF